MNDKKENDLSRKHKKYLAIAGCAGVFGIAAVFIGYSYPNVGGNVISDVLGTSMDVSDVPISTSTDEIAVPIADGEVSQDENTVSPPAGDDAPPIISTLPPKNNAAADPAPSHIAATAPILVSVPIPAPASVTACSFPDVASAALSRKIIFNEIAWMGSTSSSNAEWMEIKNISDVDIALDGWEVLNASGKIKIPFSADNDIPAGGLLLLSRDDSSTGISYSGTLANTGDVLAIMDPQCDVSDIVDASSGWPAGNNATKQTLERDADDIGWHTSVLSGGTPGAENSSIVPPIADNDTSSTSISGSAQSADVPPAPAQASSSSDDESAMTSVPEETPTINSSSDSAAVPSLSHVLIAAVEIGGVSSTNDLVKLYNPNESAVNMSGWKLHKRSSTGADYSLKEFPMGSVIAPGQYFVWANSAGGFSEAIGANVSSTETLSADNSVALFDASGTIIDAVAWGSGVSQYGEGPPYPTDPTGTQVLTRQFIGGSIADTENNANDFILQ